MIHNTEICFPNNVAIFSLIKIDFIGHVIKYLCLCYHYGILKSTIVLIGLLLLTGTLFVSGSWTWY